MTKIKEEITIPTIDPTLSTAKYEGRCTRRMYTTHFCFSRSTRSSIALIDADPGSDRSKRAAYVESHSDQVVFVPDAASRKASDEL